MGRVYKTFLNSYSCAVTVMLTPKQYAVLKALAKADHDRPLSSYLRKFLRDTILGE